MKYFVLVIKLSTLCECSSEIFCASVLVKIGPEIGDYFRKGSSLLAMRHPSIRKTLALTLPTSGNCSVDIVFSRTKATELVRVIPYKKRRYMTDY
jgi:hypothetical protein